jgi:hypothetical protein
MERQRKGPESLHDRRFAGIIAYNRVKRTCGWIVGFKDVEAPEIEEEIAQFEGRGSVSAGVIVGK